MIDRRFLLTSTVAMAGLAAFRASAAANMNVTLVPRFEVNRFINDDVVEVLHGRDLRTMKRGDVFLDYTLMDIQSGAFVVLEDCLSREGHLLTVGTDGVIQDFSKTAEPGAMSASPTVAGEPSYEATAAELPPIRSVTGEGIAFTAAPAGDRIWFSAGGQTAGFDPATYEPSIADIRASGRMQYGLVGGYLPALRFIYPESPSTWTELLAFAPFDGGALSWRINRIENGKGLRSHYANDDASGFYSRLAQLKSNWDDRLKPAMSLDVPDERTSNIARHGLVYAVLNGDDTVLRAWGAPTTGKGDLPNDIIGAGEDLIRQDDIVSALEKTYGLMAYAHVRGLWTAVKSRTTMGDADGYSPAMQAALPLLIRDLLVFEDNNTLWLAKGMPRPWLQNEKLVFVNDAPTRWGKVSFAFDSDRVRRHRILARIEFPEGGLPVETKLRFRADDGALPRLVKVNDRSWSNLDGETVTVPAGMGGKVLIEARY